MKLRSAGLGAAVLTARAPGMAAVRTTIVYGWPFIFVAAALLGGVLVALVVCVVYFGIGINLLQFQVDLRYFNEIAVFALAVLAAMFGIPALTALGTSTRGGKPAG